LQWRELSRAIMARGHPLLVFEFIAKKNCWSSDGIEPSLIDYSISTNKNEYDFFYLKVKKKLVPRYVLSG